jgi:Arc/MetJ-type ribon-helix-helix transcriptional regulator
MRTRNHDQVLDRLRGMTYHHTRRFVVPRLKIAITIEEATLRRLDDLVRRAVYPNRSQAVQAAVDEKLLRLEGDRLARECARLDPAYEKALAEEGLNQDLSEWPEY